MNAADFQIAVDHPAEVGECPTWDERTGQLFWVDIMRGDLHSFDPLSGRSCTVNVGQPLGAVAMRRDGGFVLAMHHGFALLEEGATVPKPLFDPESHLVGNRFNDGKCDPAGRFWAGTMSFDGQPHAGALYCLDLDHRVSRKVDQVTISNGLAWSLDGRVMYFVDTRRNDVVAYDFDATTGEISNSRVTVPGPTHGQFDGMTIDAEGKLWIAIFGGSAIGRYDPHSGRQIDQIDLPVSQVTSCTFGGPNLDVLYVTSCRLGLDAESLAREPFAGSLLSLTPGTYGLPAFEYLG